MSKRKIEKEFKEGKIFLVGLGDSKHVIKKCNRNSADLLIYSDRIKPLFGIDSLGYELKEWMGEEVISSMYLDGYQKIGMSGYEDVLKRNKKLLCNMILYDICIGNLDRTGSNILSDGKKLAMIDDTVCIKNKNVKCKLAKPYRMVILMNVDRKKIKKKAEKINVCELIKLSKDKEDYYHFIKDQLFHIDERINYYFKSLLSWGMNES